MAEPTRPYPIALDRMAAVSMVALLLFLSAEIVLLFVLTPSRVLLSFAGPVCHYGIIVSLLTAVILVALRSGFAIARRHRGR